jgi:hypothetical protein
LGFTFSAPCANATGHTEQCRSVFGIDLQRFLERLGGVGIRVFLDEELAPFRVHPRVVRRQPHRITEIRLRIVDTMHGARGAGRAQVIPRVWVAHVGPEDELQRLAALGATADTKLQQTGLERGVAAGVGGYERFEDGFRPRVIADRRHAQRVVDRDRFVLGKGLREGFDFVEASAAPRFLRGGACRGDACRRLLGRNQRHQSRGEDDRNEEEEGATEHLVRVYVRPLDVEHIAPGFAGGSRTYSPRL